MSQAQQIKFNLPNGDFAVLDNSAASTTSTLAGSGVNSSPIGFDTPANNSIVPAGATSQGTNVYGDTGSAGLMDSVNDTVYADPSVATFAGNPVSGTAPTYKTVSTIVQNGTQGIFVKWKNPATWILACMLVRHLF
jgi:hypothetical protein